METITKELKTAEKKHVLLTENLTDVVYTMDFNQRFTYISPSVERFLGYTVDEIMELTADEILTPASFRYQSEELQKVLRKGGPEVEQPRKLELEVVRKDGSTFWAEIHARVLFNKERQPIGLLGIGRDISDRKKAEHALKESEKKYRWVFENSPMAMSLIDNKGNIIEMNNRIYEWLGYRTEEMIGKNLMELEFLPEKSKAIIKKNLSQRLKGTKVDPYEIEFIHKNGKTVTGRVNAIPIKDNKGNIVGDLATIANITGQKILERQKEVLQQRLRDYAKKLEIKLKKFEENKMNLTPNEKLVLYGMTANPSATDKELAKKLSLRRTTVTTIRNKLKKKKIYEMITIPNFDVLGYNLLSAILGKSKISADQLKKIRKLGIMHGVIDFMANESGFGAVLLSKDIAEFHKYQESFTRVLQRLGIFNKIPIVRHFPFETSRVVSFLDMSSALKKKFSLKIRHTLTENIFTKAKKRGLKENEKKILYALVKFPKSNIYELSEITGFAKPTIIKIKKRLFKEGFVQKRIVPNVQKLGFGLMCMCNLVYKPDITKQTIEKIESLAGSCLFFINSKTGCLATCYFKDYDEYQKVRQNLPHKAVLEEFNLNMPLKNIVKIAIDPSLLVKRILNLDVDY